MWLSILKDGQQSYDFICGFFAPWPQPAVVTNMPKKNYQQRFFGTIILFSWYWTCLCPGQAGQYSDDLTVVNFLLPQQISEAFTLSFLRLCNSILLCWFPQPNKDNKPSKEIAGVWLSLFQMPLSERSHDRPRSLFITYRGQEAAAWKPRTDKWKEGAAQQGQ